jgi:hypothetical protein
MILRIRVPPVAAKGSLAPSYLSSEALRDPAEQDLRFGNTHWGAAHHRVMDLSPETLG